MNSGTFLWSLTFCVWCTQNVSTYEFDFKHPDGSEIRYLSDYCKNSDCVVKCCPKNAILLYMTKAKKGRRICIESATLEAKYGVKGADNYSDIALYDKNIENIVIKTEKTANDFKFIYDSNFIINNISNARYLPSYANDPQFRTYLLEDGKWVFRRVNYWHQFTIFEPQHFCIEHQIILYVENYTVSSTIPSVVVWVISNDTFTEFSNTRNISSAYGMLISCFFLLLVLAVYAALPELRSLAGMMFMACMATYFAFFMIRVIQVFTYESGNLPPDGCVTLTIIFYYLMLSSFCWMNAISFDIWWAIRGVRKLSPLSQRRVTSKFLWYCAYAWGAPLLPTLFVVVVDTLDLTRWENFVTPHIFQGACFFDAESHWLYVNLPMILLICVNLVFFAMTTFIICRITVIDISRNRFLMYLKMALIMGVSWILEVVGNISAIDSPVLIITDLCNALIGVFIFWLFICKKKIFLQLCSRFSIDNRVVRYVRDDADAVDSCAPNDAPVKVNQETATNNVDANWTPSYKDIKSKSEDSI